MEQREIEIDNLLFPGYRVFGIGRDVSIAFKVACEVQALQSQGSINLGPRAAKLKGEGTKCPVSIKGK